MCEADLQKNSLKYRERGWNRRQRRFEFIMLTLVKRVQVGYCLFDQAFLLKLCSLRHELSFVDHLWSDQNKRTIKWNKFDSGALDSSRTSNVLTLIYFRTGNYCRQSIASISMLDFASLPLPFKFINTPPRLLTQLNWIVLFAAVLPLESSLNARACSIKWLMITLPQK